MLSILNNNRGSALPTVIIFLIIISFLSLALANLTVVDYRQKTYQANKMQAYYLARTGAESTLDAWIERELYNEDIVPYGSIQRVYLEKYTEEFVQWPPPENYIGYFDVKIEEHSGATKFTAIGYCRGVTEQVVVILDEHGGIYWID